MRLVLIVFVVLCLAGAGTVVTTRVVKESPRSRGSLLLDIAATGLAQSPARVTCYGHKEKDGPYIADEWGFYDGKIGLDETVCDGALAIRLRDSSVARWKWALGVLILTHEAFHQRWPDLSEAEVECQAIRFFRLAVQLLGGSRLLASQLLPYGLAMHFQLGFEFPAYRTRCDYPWYW